MRMVWAIARKDLWLFFSDRRGVVVAFVTPIAIAAFFGFLFSGGGSSERAKIPLRVVDLDGSAVSLKILDGLSGEEALAVTPQESADEAEELVRRGKTAVAVVIPEGFGDAAAHAFFGVGARPSVRFLYDPSRSAELAMVRGILTRYVMEAVSSETFTARTGRKVVDDALAGLENESSMEEADRDALRNMLEGVRGWQDRVMDGGSEQASGTSGGPGSGLTIPFDVADEAVTAREGVKYNGYAHSFGGMGVQFVLFTAIELGVGILEERRRRLWMRLRAAPVSRTVTLMGKWLGGTLIALMTMGITFAAGILFFNVRVEGSWAAFLLLILASSLLASSFGLLLAALGKTPNATRGLAIFVVLLLTMLGGGWVPAFLFPAWMQKLTLAIPTRWAVDGFDLVTWRGAGLAQAALPVAMVLAFTALFAAVALLAFRWEED